MSSKIVPTLEGQLYKTSGNAAVGSSKKDQQRDDYRKGRESTTSLRLRLPTSLYQELREIAFKTEDKMTPIIIRALENHIKALKK